MKLGRLLTYSLIVCFLTGCYDDYKTDYDYSAIFFPYQYDLRSIVIGEDTAIDYGCMLSGVIKNYRNRIVNYSIDDELLTVDLTSMGGKSSAVQGFINGTIGSDLTQSYAQTAVVDAGLLKFTPLPKNYYKVSDDSQIIIKEGRNTGTVHIDFDESALLSDDNFGHSPFYAIALKINYADADSILFGKSFEIIAFRAENTLFGSWYHYGKSVTITSDGETQTNYYSRRKPSDDSTWQTYELETISPYVVLANRFHNNTSGKMNIEMKNGEVKVYDSAGTITDMGSSWNRTKLLQNRQVYLNYKYLDNSGSTVFVSDTLEFRNRLRDGVNEWQDENPEHYK